MATAIDEIREWFEACGYAVTEQVGAGAGEVDRFATSRSGLMPPRTWWTVVEKFPERLDEAVENLDLARDARGADRALAIVTDDVTPDGYLPDLNGGVANYVTLRYLALTLGGVFEQLGRINDEVETAPYFPHRLSLPSGEAGDACELIELWIESGREDTFELDADPDRAISDVLREVTRRQTRQFLKAPDRVVPIVSVREPGLRSAAVERLINQRWIILANPRGLGREAIVLRRARRPSYLGSPASKLVGTLIGPTVDDVMAWLRTAAPELPSDAIRAWLRHDESSRQLLIRSPVRTALLEAARVESEARPDDSWLPKILARVFQQIIDQVPKTLGVGRRSLSLLEDVALRDFALGRTELSEAPGERGISAIARSTGLLAMVPAEVDSYREQYVFRSRAVRDWFLAKKIARDVRAGDRELLTRYNFPREYALLFLAVVAPDVAASMTADRSEGLRHEIESQVERQVQLTLGHQLNRSVGAIGSNLKHVQRALEIGRIDENARIGMTRIEEELAHLARLTERSRLLYESEAWQPTSLVLADVAAQVLDPLREQHPEVAVHLAVPPEILVRAALDGLREVLHCLVENAFHSVRAAPDEPRRSIEVHAEREGETVKVRVRDNGRGVRPEDRERIFEPFVTTKKGGTGQPRGTGLGLTIARKFAERMGARVVLEASNGATVFVVTFVAGGSREQ